MTENVHFQKLLIGGEWVDSPSGIVFTSLNPYSGEPATTSAAIAADT